MNKKITIYNTGKSLSIDLNRRLFQIKKNFIYVKSKIISFDYIEKIIINFNYVTNKYQIKIEFVKNQGKIISIDFYIDEIDETDFLIFSILLRNSHLKIVDKYLILDEILKSEEHLIDIVKKIM